MNSPLNKNKNTQKFNEYFTMNQNENQELYINTVKGMNDPDESLTLEKDLYDGQIKEMRLEIEQLATLKNKFSLDNFNLELKLKDFIVKFEHVKEMNLQLSQEIDEQKMLKNQCEYSLEASKIEFDKPVRENKQLKRDLQDLLQKINEKQEIADNEMTYRHELELKLKELTDSSQFESKLYQQEIEKLRSKSSNSDELDNLRQQNESLTNMCRNYESMIQNLQQQEEEEITLIKSPKLNSTTPPQNSIQKQITRPMTASSSLNGGKSPLSSEYQLSARLVVYPSISNFELSQLNEAQRPKLLSSTTTDITTDLFNKFEKNTFFHQTKPPQSPSGSTTTTTITEASYTGNVKIHEVNKDGYFIRLLNVSSTQDEDLSNYTLQQVVSTMPVAVYRLAANVKLPPGHTLTVWSRTDQVQEQPPFTFVWNEQEKFGTGPECTTILTKPNGQAISWTTGSHRYGTVYYDEILPLYAPQNRNKTAQTYLNRQKLCQQRLFTPTKHPHGHDNSTSDDTSSSSYFQRNIFSNQKARPINSAQSRKNGSLRPSTSFNIHNDNDDNQNQDDETTNIYQENHCYALKSQNRNNKIK